MGHLEVIFFGENKEYKTQLSIQKRWNLNINENIDYKSYEIPKIDKNVILKTIELKDVAEKIEDLKNLNDQKSKDKHESSQTFYLMLGILLMVGTVIGLVLTTLYLFKRQLDKITKEGQAMTLKARKPVREIKVNFKRNNSVPVPNKQNETARGRAIV